MDRPFDRLDCAELERYVHHRNEICSQMLLDALRMAHPEMEPEEVRATEEAKPESGPLPPIPNKLIEQAAAVAFPHFHGQVETIQRATLEEFPNVTLPELKSQRRNARIVKARQIAMYLAKTMTARSLPEIGRRFGGRDHTTVLHAVRKIETLIPRDPVIAAQVERIRESVSERVSC